MAIRLAYVGKRLGGVDDDAVADRAALVAPEELELHHDLRADRHDAVAAGPALAERVEHRPQTLPREAEADLASVDQLAVALLGNAQRLRGGAPVP
jgi:hypothetical protein